MKSLHYITVHLLLQAVNPLFSQHHVLPNDYFFNAQITTCKFYQSPIPQYTDDSSMCFSVSRLINPSSWFNREQIIDSIFGLKGKKRFTKKLLDESLIRLNTLDSTIGEKVLFKLEIDPVFHFQTGRDLKDTSNETTTINSRGFWLKAQIGKEFFLESFFFENQAVFPTYIDQFATSGVINGQGRWKKFNSNGYDYAFASGALSYLPNKHLEFQIGNGKQKFGQGYRSLFLSDNSFTYPFFRSDFHFFNSKLNYTCVFASLMNLSDGGALTPKGTERLFQKKPASFQSMQWRIDNHFYLSFFQGATWQTTDSLNRIQLDAAYFNPVLYTNLALYGLNTKKNNAYIGVEMNWQAFKWLTFYSQYLLDEVLNGKINQSFQGGARINHCEGRKSFLIQLETNIQKYDSLSLYNHHHYSQSFMLPYLSSKSNEFIGIAAFRFRRFFVLGKSVYRKSDDKAIDLSYSLIDLDGRVGYVINPASNFNVSLGGVLRRSKSSNTATNKSNVNNTAWFTISLKTSLNNTYWDY